MANSDPKSNGKPPLSRSARLPESKPAMTPLQRLRRDWVDTRNAWFRSGFTGIEDGALVPDLGPWPTEENLEVLLKRKRA